MRRLVEASASGTQAAHLCHAAADADRKAFTAMITQQKAFLPYVETSVWSDDRNAQSCYNACGWPASKVEGVPRWCERAMSAVS